MVLLLVLFGATPAEAQLFRKIFGKSGGSDRNAERQEMPVSESPSTPVVDVPVPASKPDTAVDDPIISDKPVIKSSPTPGLGKRETTPGYRIQIYNGSNRADAMRLKQEMENSYPDMSVHLVYRPPNFRVRIGDFRNQRDAEQLLPQFRQLGYKTSFVVPDEVFVGTSTP
jgi:cell division septation protein DedD